MAPLTWTFATAAPPPPGPEQGPGRSDRRGRPAPRNPYSTYLAEMLRTEGLNEFKTIDVGTLSPATLAAYDVVVLGAVSVTAAQAADLTTWVNGGGNLIAIKPSTDRCPACSGLTATSGTTDRRATSRWTPRSAAGAGIVADTIQFHGAADRYSLTAGAGTQSVATIYSNATTATTTFPAVTLRTVGSSGGQAAAFTYDLPRSVVQTRQGNPAWAGHGARRPDPDPLRRPVLRRQLHRLGQPEQGRHPAGRRAAAAAGQPDPGDEPRPEAAAALLVLPAEPQGGRHRHR